MKLSRSALFSILALIVLTSALLAACTEEPEPVTIIKEVPVEVIKEVEVEKEVIKEVEVEKEVIKEVEVEVEKEVIKEVEVEGEGGGEDCRGREDRRTHSSTRGFSGTADLPDGNLRGTDLQKLLELLRRSGRFGMDSIRARRSLRRALRLLGPTFRLGTGSSGRFPDRSDQRDGGRRRVLDGRGPHQERCHLERWRRARRQRFRLHRQHRH